MKKILSILLLLSFSFPKGTVFADQNWKSFSGEISKCTLDSSPTLITKLKPPYVKYDDKEINTTYDKYYKDLKITRSFSDLDSLGDPFDKAKTLYTETQNLIFNCAILNSKLKIGQKIMNSINKKGKDTNNTKKIKDQGDILIKQINENECHNFAKDDNKISFKMILLDNVTYQNCIYINYLDYMDKHFGENMGSGSKNKNGITLSTNNISYETQKLSNDINAEIIHSKTVYNQSLIAYSEFENTYGIHILLLFIFDDYIAMRNTLEKTLAPLSQLFYKIPNAQKQ